MRSLAVVVILRLVAAAGAAALPVDHRQEAVTETVREFIEPRFVRHEQGHCYIAALRMGRTGDREAESHCVLLEDDRPLPHPHSLHRDIRQHGKGRYSHWSRNSLYFSASDNSDPRTNGKRYVLQSTRQVLRHRALVRAGAGASEYSLPLSAEHRLVTRRLTWRHESGAPAIVHLRRRGDPDLRSIEGILASILRPGMSDEEKALAIWRFLVDWRYHYYPAEGGDEIHDPVKFINVYGYGFCDDSASNTAVLARAAGLRARIWGLSGHVVGEVFWNDRWHMLDPDHQVVYRAPDGHIASVEELAAHPEWITATPRDPVGSDSVAIAKLYTTSEDNHPSDRSYKVGHRLQPLLLPGDEVTFNYIGASEVHRQLFTDQALPPVAGNGVLRRTWKPSAGARLQWHMRWPYVALGGRVRVGLAAGRPRPQVSASSDGEQFDPLPPVTEGGSTPAYSLDEWVRDHKGGLYEMWIRVGDGASAEAVHEVRLSWRFQFAPRALAPVDAEKPVCVVELTPQTDAPVTLTLEHEWDEVLER